MKMINRKIIYFVFTVVFAFITFVSPLAMLFAKASTEATVTLEETALGKDANIGSIVDDSYAGNGKAIKSLSAAPSGNIVFGGNSSFTSTQKICKLFIKVSNIPTDKTRRIANLEVAPVGQAGIVNISINGNMVTEGQYSEVSTPFTTQTGTTYEFRVFYDGTTGSTVYVDKIEISDDNTVVGNDIIINAISMGSNTGTKTAIGVVCTPSNSSGHMTWGPGNADLISSGKKICRIYIKGTNLPATSATAVTNFDIFDGTSSVAMQSINAGLLTEGQLVTIDIPFSAQASKPYQFRMYYYNTTGATIEVQKYAIIDDVSLPVPDGSTIIEAATMSSNTGTKTLNGIICMPSNSSGHMTWGPGNANLISAGGKICRIYMKGTNLPAIATTAVTAFDIYNGTNVVVDKTITAELMTEGQTVTIDVPFTAEANKPYQFRMYYFNTTGATIEVQKYAIFTDPSSLTTSDPNFKQTINAVDLSSNTGRKITTGITGIMCLSGRDKANHCTFGGNLTLDPGDYKISLYAKLIRKTGGPNTVVANFDLYYQLNQNNIFPIEATKITESQFPQEDTYVVFTYTFSLAEKVVGLQPRVYYYGTEDFEVNKFIVMGTNVTPEEPVQEKYQPPVRPNDAILNDTYNTSLTTENIVFVKGGIQEDTGSIQNGSVIFNISNDEAGGIDNISKGIYLTKGQKKARFYLRLLDNNSRVGTAKVGVLRISGNGLTVSSITLTAADFGDINSGFVYDVPFEADENVEYNFGFIWLAQCSVAFDRVEFVNSGDSVYEGNKKEVLSETLENGSASFIIKPDMIAGMNMLDKFVINYGESILLIPVSSVYSTLSANKSIILTFDPVSDEIKNEIIKTISDKSYIDVALGYSNCKIELINNTDNTKSILSSFDGNIFFGYKLSEDMKKNIGSNLSLAQIYSFDLNNKSFLDLNSFLDESNSVVWFTSNKISLTFLGKTVDSVDLNTDLSVPNTNDEIIFSVILSVFALCIILTLIKSKQYQRGK